jgi:hypothetical protein
VAAATVANLMTTFLLNPDRLALSPIGQHSIAIHPDQGCDEHHEGDAKENFAAYH